MLIVARPPTTMSRTSGLREDHIREYGDSRSGLHDISPSKRQRSSFAWQLVEDVAAGCDLPKAEDRRGSV